MRMFDYFFFFFQAEDGIRDKLVTGVQTCALPISTAKNTIAPLILRMALAVIFLYHGQQLIVPEQTRYGSNWMPKENAQHPAIQLAEIGRASCRERVEIAVVAGK